MSRFGRRDLIRAGAAAGVGAALGGRTVPVQLGAQEVLVTASGAGVNLKLMPDEAGAPRVPMRRFCPGLPRPPKEPGDSAPGSFPVSRGSS